MADLNVDDLEEILDDDDDYVGTQIVYRCLDCGLEVVVKEDEEAPDTCECGGDLQIVGEEIYDEAQDLDEEDSGLAETEILQDEVGDTDISEETDENTGVVFDQSEEDEHIDKEENLELVEEAEGLEEPDTFAELNLEPEEEELTLDEGEDALFTGLEEEEEEGMG